MKPAIPAPKASSQDALRDLRRRLRQPQTARVKPEPTPPPIAAVRAEPVPTAADRALFRAAAAGAMCLGASMHPPPPGLQPVPPQPIPRQSLRDERAVLVEAMSDELDLDHLLETDAALSWRREGVGADTLRKLRRGHWTIQHEIDLHGLRRDEAREALGQFLRTALQREWRCVRVIHGKGLSSPQREPVLKHKVRSWLMQRDEVMAYVQARPSDGGAGALVVLLRSARRMERSVSGKPGD
ncbi:MAG: Smr/MutS family protein [Thiomonas sp.]|uniref:Smr/MutS family protein n=1 Tax=Thiomonas sp. TaxID=2047785 RepID=UPI002A359E97|nr:Smr/MutS family protein [Thiomonas sp.]MDY0330399.1 Smr/MutS family protein [Thiomonas sp.]